METGPDAGASRSAACNGHTNIAKRPGEGRMPPYEAPNLVEQRVARVEGGL